MPASGPPWRARRGPASRHTARCPDGPCPGRCRENAARRRNWPGDAAAWGRRCGRSADMHRGSGAVVRASSARPDRPNRRGASRCLSRCTSAMRRRLRSRAPHSRCVRRSVPCRCRPSGGSPPGVPVRPPPVPPGAAWRSRRRSLRDRRPGTGRPAARGCRPSPGSAPSRPRAAARCPPPPAPRPAVRCPAPAGGARPAPAHVRRHWP